METEPKTYSVSEIAKAIGEKPRAVQFWADMGVLRPEQETFRKGRGVHRRFNASELQYARAAASITATNGPMTEIIAVVEHLRKFGLQGAIDEFTEFQSLLKQIGSDEESAVSRRSVLREFVRLVELGDIFYSGGEGVSAVLAYSREKDIPIAVGFWTNTVSAVFKNDVQLFASILTDRMVGFKAIEFSDVATQLDIIQRNAGDSHLKELFGNFLVKHTEALVRVVHMLSG